MSAPAAQRIERIDTLRGIAVFGILLVNVWGLATGMQMLRYGVLDAVSSRADMLAIAFVAAFAEVKFYPIFAFLFGAGFALQTRTLIRTAGGVEQAAWFYRRRLKWLLVCGLLHGVLLWYGDILHAYAITGFVLLTACGRRLAQVRRMFMIALAFNVAFLVLGLIVSFAVGEPSVQESNEALYDVEYARVVFAQGGAGVLAMARLKAFAVSLLGVVAFLPELATLFFAGVFAVRLGWLTRPWKHRRGWRIVQLVGFGIGLPFNLWWASVAVAEARDPVGAHLAAMVGHGLLQIGGTLMAATYVATVMLAGPWLARALAWLFAPVGRMALSNYLMQSLLGVVMLEGVGLGWARWLSHTGLLLWCAGVMVAQVLISRWWLSGHAQGPMEAIWRRYTYRA